MAEISGNEKRLILGHSKRNVQKRSFQFSHFYRYILDTLSLYNNSLRIVQQSFVWCG